MFGLDHAKPTMRACKRVRKPTCRLASTSVDAGGWHEPVLMCCVHNMLRFSLHNGNARARTCCPCCQWLLLRDRINPLVMHKEGGTLGTHQSRQSSRDERHALGDAVSSDQQRSTAVSRRPTVCALQKHKKLLKAAAQQQQQQQQQEGGAQEPPSSSEDGERSNSSSDEEEEEGGHDSERERSRKHQGGDAEAISCVKVWSQGLANCTDTPFFQVGNRSYHAWDHI
jgi:hypothetical protein